MSDFDALSAAHSEVKAEIARTDTKASLLLAFAGAVGAGTWAVADGADLPGAVLAVGGTGLAAIVAAVAVLLTTVRPNLGDGRRARGFPRWATLTAQEIRDDLARDMRAEDIAQLSRIASGKFAALRRAIDLMRLGGGLLVLAGVLAVLVRLGGAV